MKQLVFLLVLLVGIMGAAAWFSKETNTERIVRVIEQRGEPKVVVGGNVVVVEVMDTPEKRSQGLSGREGLEEGRGMLFKFDSSSSMSFWMKDMRFAIDIIWIRDEGVVKIDAEVPPPELEARDGGLKLYYSPGEVDWVLEVPAGYAERVGIEVEDKVDFKNL